MAQIDIKNCNFYLQDGYIGPGGTPLINHSGGYSAAATSIVVDGFVGAVAIGDIFTIAGDTSNGQYVVTAHTETTSNTTSITFTPGLGASVADDAAITMLPHTIKIRIGEGNAQWTEKRPVTYVKDRGLLDTVRLGDQEPVEVKLDFTWIFLVAQMADTAPTIEEFFKKKGKASAYISSAADQCEPYAVDILIEYTPPCLQTQTYEVYTIADFRYEELGHDLKQGQVSVSGKCNTVEVTTTRPTLLPII